MNIINNENFSPFPHIFSILFNYLWIWLCLINLIQYSCTHTHSQIQIYFYYFSIFNFINEWKSNTQPQTQRKKLKIEWKRIMFFLYSCKIESIFENYYYCGDYWFLPLLFFCLSKLYKLVSWFVHFISIKIYFLWHDIINNMELMMNEVEMWLSGWKLNWILLEQLFWGNKFELSHVTFYLSSCSQN